MDKCLRCKINYYCNRSYGSQNPPCSKENHGTQPTDTQQLKAEIAALVTEASDYTKFSCNQEIVMFLLTKMRQLSAV